MSLAIETLLAEIEALSVAYSSRPKASWGETYDRIAMLDRCALAVRHEMDAAKPARPRAPSQAGAKIDTPATAAPGGAGQQPARYGHRRVGRA
jgi:hypothetical protein